MSVRRVSRNGRWFFRTTIQTLDGHTLRLCDTPGVPGPCHDLSATRVGAQEAEPRAIREVFAPKPAPSVTKEVPTFEEWFQGAFWSEWVIGKPGVQYEKQTIYLEPILALVIG